MLQPLVKEFIEFLNQLLNLNTIALLGTVFGGGYKLFTKLIKSVEKKQDVLIERISEDTRDLKREVLRIQILQGIDTERLSESELSYFYDKYKELGGNSFISDRVEKYRDKLSNQKAGDN